MKFKIIDVKGVNQYHGERFEGQPVSPLIVSLEARGDNGQVYYFSRVWSVERWAEIEAAGEWEER